MLPSVLRISDNALQEETKAMLPSKAEVKQAANTQDPAADAPKKKKRKGPKGPNPLSVKKKKPKPPPQPNGDSNSKSSAGEKRKRDDGGHDRDAVDDSAGRNKRRREMPSAGPES